MCDVLFVWTALSNMFGARMRTTLAQWLVSIDTASCLRTSLVQYLKMANEEEASMDVAELRENETEDTPSRKRKQSKAKARKWNDEETDLLIDLLEQNGCLWDVFSKEYHLRDKRDQVYETMQEELGISIADIKYKITGLRSQLGREVAKTNQKKSGQGVGENYKSAWIYWDRLQFLMPVIKAGKSKDSLQASVDRQSSVSPDTKQIEEDVQNDTENQENESQTTPRAKLPKRKTEQELTSKKHALLDRCLHVLQEPMQSQEKQCHFSMHIAEKLASFDRRTRLIAEKRINDIIFELEMGDHSQSPAFPRHPGNSMQYSSSDCSQGSYMGMLQSQAPHYHNF